MLNNLHNNFAICNYCIPIGLCHIEESVTLRLVISALVFHLALAEISCVRAARGIRPHNGAPTIRPRSNGYAKGLRWTIVGIGQAIPDTELLTTRRSQGFLFHMIAFEAEGEQDCERGSCSSRSRQLTCRFPIWNRISISSLWAKVGWKVLQEKDWGKSYVEEELAHLVFVEDLPNKSTSL